MRQPTFTTTRLVLTPAVASDVEALWIVWRDPEVRRFLFDDQPVTRGRASEVLDSCLESGERGLGLWTVQERDADGIVGCAGLLSATTVADYDPSLRGLVEVLAALAPSVWGRGYAQESLTTLLAYAFGTLALPRLAGVNDVPNTASARMLDRLGFTVTNKCDGPAYRMRVAILESHAFENEETS